RLRERRRREQRAAAGTRQAPKARPEEVGQVVRDGQRPGPGVLWQRPRELEREERVAARGSLDPDERRPCERASELALEHLVERGKTQRPEPYAAGAQLAQQRVERRGYALVGREPACGEEADALGRE